MSRRPAPRTVVRRRVDPARLAAWRTLRAVQAEDAYANLVLPRLLREQRLDGRDAAFATELAYGALRGQGSYDAVIGACSARPLAAIDPAVLDALRLGTHQLLATRVPAHAAVAATVDLVRAEIGQGAGGFTNAVLRRVADHDREAWLDRLAAELPDEDDRLALRYSHPAWIVRAMRDALRHHGRHAGELEALLAADNASPTVTLAALPGLCAQGEPAGERGALSPYAVRITGAPGALRAVREGRARVQDEGSQVVALAVADTPTTEPDRGVWLDLCAGPGGKAALLGAVLLQRRTAGDLPSRAQLLATEVAPHRADLVRASVAAVNRAAATTSAAPTSAAPTPRRDHAEIHMDFCMITGEAGGAWSAAGSGGGPAVRVEVADGRQLDQLLGDGAHEAFDRVLLDAPCTGLGALRRRPEARWRRRPADLAALGPLQRQLLRAALDAVRPGGVVGYVTCSPHPAETTLVVDDVLRRDGYAAVAERVGPDRQLWPHVDGTDAMYLAVLRRVRSGRP